jgi:hypothetical protein
MLHMQSGIVYGKHILGCPARSTNCEELAGEINSLRVESNTIIMISDSVSLYNGHSQVITGPIDIPHNIFKINSILVTRFKDYNYITPAPGPLVILYSNMSTTGMSYNLFLGNYSLQRLMSEEVKINPKDILSMQISQNALVTITANNKTILVSGPRTVNDMQSIGLADSIISAIDVKYNVPEIVQPERTVVHYRTPQHTEPQYTEPQYTESQKQNKDIADVDQVVNDSCDDMSYGSYTLILIIILLIICILIGTILVKTEYHRTI